MKSAKWFLLSGLIGLFACNVMIHAMEVPAEKYVFIKTPITDITDYAIDLSEASGEEYEIVTHSRLLEKYLETFGLTVRNTLLDLRYNYNLMIQKLSKEDPLYNAIQELYNRLMLMFFVFDEYREELYNFSKMNFEQVKAIELESIPKKNQYRFLKNTDRSINKMISVLRNHRRQYNLKQLSQSSIQDFFNLPSNASHQSIEKHYHDYMKTNSRDKLIALKKMKKMSSADFKNKMFEVEQVKKIYERYLSEKQ